MRIPSGVTDQYIYFVALDATDLKTRETGLSSFTVYRSRNGGAAAAYTTPTINETDSTNMPGVYELLLDEDMTIDSGDDSQEVCLHITHSGMAPVTRTFELYRPKATAGETLTVSSGTGNAQVKGIDANQITASSIAADAITAAKLASDVADEIWAKTCTEPTAVVAASPTAIAALSWLLTLSRNKITQTATTQLLKADDGTTTVATSTISDDGTTFTRGEFA